MLVPLFGLQMFVTIYRPQADAPGAEQYENFTSIITNLQVNPQVTLQVNQQVNPTRRSTGSLKGIYQQITLQVNQHVTLQMNQQVILQVKQEVTLSWIIYK